MQLLVGGAAGLAEEQAMVVAKGLPCEELAEVGVEDFPQGLEPVVGPQDDPLPADP